MLVVLARATLDGHTLLGYNCDRPSPQALVTLPGRSPSPGEVVRATHLELPQARRLWGALGCRCGPTWGLEHGVNEKGVAVGVTSIHTRLERDGPGLTGPDLVRLALERGGSAMQAVDVLTDLIGRHGQSGEEGSDCAFLVADGQEAHVLEASGRHWALQAVTAVRAVTGACHLRRDWDRISRGLADLAIERGWWPQDGNKVDFAGAVGVAGPGHAEALYRWAQVTTVLEDRAGKWGAAGLRAALAGEGALTGPPRATSPGSLPTRLIAHLPAGPGHAAVAWWSFGGELYFPLLLAGPLPAAFLDDGGAGCSLRRQMARWHADARRDPRLRAGLRSGLARLQEQFDQLAREAAAEAAEVEKRGACDELVSLAGSFMQHAFERFDELAASLSVRAPEPMQRPHAREQEVGAAPEAFF
jgi:hypothetical protein